VSGWGWLLVAFLVGAPGFLYACLRFDRREMRRFYEENGRYPCEVHEVAEPYIAAQTRLPCTCGRSSSRPGA
jgi:hypothetical protein